MNVSKISARVRTAILIAAIVAPLVAAGSGPQAQTLSGGEAYNTIIMEEVQNYLNLLDPTVKLEASAEVGSPDPDGSIKIRFSDVTLTGNGDVAQLGDISLQLRPMDNRQVGFDLSWPGMVRFFQDGQATAILRVSSPVIKGVWDPELAMFTALDGMTGRVMAIHQHTSGDEEVFSLEALNFEVENVRSVKERMNGTVNIRLQDILVQGDTNIHMEEVILRGSNTGTPVGAGNPGVPMISGFATAERFAEILQGPLDLGSGDSEITARGLTATKEGQVIYKVAKITYGLGLDFSGKLSDANIVFEIREPELPALASLPAHFTPDRLRLDMDFLNIPLRETFAEILQEDFETTGSANEAAQQQRMVSLLGKLVNGISIDVKSFELTLPEAQARIQGTLLTESAAEYTVHGELHGEISGLDALMANIPSDKLKNFLPILALVKGFGQPRAASDGSIKYVYDVRIPVTGPILINNNQIK